VTPLTIWHGGGCGRRYTYDGRFAGCGLHYLGGRNIYCGCSMCTGRIGRRYSRRQARARWRGVRQRLLAASPDDRGDVDAHIPDGSAW
jgi:hypothetical protein